MRGCPPPSGGQPLIGDCRGQPTEAGNLSHTRCAAISCCSAVSASGAGARRYDAGRAGHAGLLQHGDAGAPRADRLGVPPALLDQQQHARVDGGRAGPRRPWRRGRGSASGAGAGAPASRIASNSTDRPVAKVRCTGRSPTMPPCGAISSGTMPASNTARRTCVDAVEVAVGVDDDADHPAVGRPLPADLRQRGAGRDLGQRHRRLRRGQAEAGGDLLAQHRVDVGQALELTLLDRLVVALGQLEGVGPDDVLLLDRRHAQPEQPGLAVVVVERGRVRADLGRLRPPSPARRRTRARRRRPGTGCRRRASSAGTAPPRRARRAGGSRRAACR